jgi:hypothetical protein
MTGKINFNLFCIQFLRGRVRMKVAASEAA